MVEVKGNLWTYDPGSLGVIRVITTNGTVKKDGTCVMGRGCAQEARDRFKGIDKALGTYIKEGYSNRGEAPGNIPHFLWRYYEPEHDIVTLAEHRICNWIYSFPVKHNWWEQADLNLIQESAVFLVQEVDTLQGKWGDTPIKVVMPRPGCGNGRLTWEKVKPAIGPLLDDRFHVITF